MGGVKMFYTGDVNHYLTSKISAKVTAKYENIMGKDEIRRMQILVLAATNLEIAPFLAENKAIDVLIPGVGVPATIYHLQKKLSANTYQLVIQAGIAGAFPGKLDLGDVATIERDNFADIGMEAGDHFTSIFKSGLMNGNEFPFENGWLLNKFQPVYPSALRSVTGITVNKVSDNPVQMQQLVSNLSPDTESMEGAALHYTCLQEQVPFLQLRAISNIVGERDMKKWALDESIKNLNEELLKIVNHFEVRTI